MAGRILLTGASGFVGAHVLRHLLANTDREITCPVTFRHRGNSDRIASALAGNDAWHQRVRVVICDLAAPVSATTAVRFGPVDEIWNVASDSHVDRSIDEPARFTENNVSLILNLLDYARQIRPRLFLQMSTDEVYGPAKPGQAHAEWSPIIPSNPYSASKAAQESVCISYWRTYGVPVVITNCWDMETRLLTRNGLKGYSEIREGDLVWSLDKNEQMTLVPVQRKVLMPGPDQMIQLSGHVNQLLTPNHRVMLRCCTGSPRRWGPIEEVRAEDLPSWPGRFAIPRRGTWSGDDTEFIEPAKLAELGPVIRGKGLPETVPAAWLATLFGWYITEGCQAFTTVRIGAGSDEQARVIENLLTGLGKVYRNGRAVCVANGQLARLLDTSGTGARGKRIPGFIKDMAPEFLTAFLDAAIAGDGTRYGDGAVIYTVSELLAADYATVAMKAGYAVRISKRWTEPFPGRNGGGLSYIVRLSRRDDSYLEARNVSVVPYSGDVWCVSVPTGQVFTEREGAIALTGQTMNIIGQMQDPEKMVPKTIRSLVRGDPVTVHVSPDGVPGSRYYLHARNLADAWLWISRTREPQMYPEHDVPLRYHIVGEREVANTDLAVWIGDILGIEPQLKPVSFHESRPGHDLRYALDGCKITADGWKAPVPFGESLQQTVLWSVAHPAWLGLAPDDVRGLI